MLSGVFDQAQQLMAYLSAGRQNLSQIKPALTHWHSQISDWHLHMGKSWSPADVEVCTKSANVLGEVELVSP